MGSFGREERRKWGYLWGWGRKERKWGYLGGVRGDKGGNEDIGGSRKEEMRLFGGLGGREGEWGYWGAGKGRKWGYWGEDKEGNGVIGGLWED